MEVTWAVINQRGVTARYWDARTVFGAIRRITTYWAVRYRQSTTSVSMPIYVAATGRTPMWTSGRSIWVNAAYRWINQRQAELAMAHEMLHWFDGGRNRHAPPGNVMQPVIGDPAQQFTRLDASGWMSRVPWAGARRPWDEPGAWRVSSELMEGGWEEIRLGCCLGFWDRVLNAWRESFGSWEIQRLEEP